MHSYAGRRGLTRRRLLDAAARAGLSIWSASRALRAAEFWDAKDPSAWTTDEILLLTTQSPWARDTRIDFKGKSAEAADVLGAAPIRNPTTGNIDNSQNGADGRTPGKPKTVVVTWQSALPLYDALKFRLPADFINHYVIGVTDLPIVVDAGPRRDTAEQLVDWLKNSATLQAKPRDPVEAGVVATARNGSMVLFGFLRELLPLTVKDKEVIFTLDTNQLALRAKFAPKQMVYRGKLAL